MNSSNVTNLLLKRENLHKLQQEMNQLHEDQVKLSIKRHDQEITAEVFLFLVFSLQILICVGQKYYANKFNEISFYFLALYPITLFYHYENLTKITFVFILMWASWGIYTARLMYKAMGPPFATRRWELEKHTPEKVYTWFLLTHRACYGISFLAILLFLVFPGPALLIIFISLYFGVLARDCADICTNKISSTIGYLKYEVPPTNICALCDEELVPTLDIMLGDKRADDPEIITNPAIKLGCGHEFHKRCILGWTMVGKKDTCPFCKEKVKFEDFLTVKAWNSPRLNVWWVSCLSFMRFILVWNPLVSYTVIYFLKIFHFEPMVDSHGRPLF